MAQKYSMFTSKLQTHQPFSSDRYYGVYCLTKWPGSTPSFPLFSDGIANHAACRQLRITHGCSNFSLVSQLSAEHLIFTVGQVIWELLGELSGKTGKLGDQKGVLGAENFGDSVRGLKLRILGWNFVSTWDLTREFDWGMSEVEKFFLTRPNIHTLPW